MTPSRTRIVGIVALVVSAAAMAAGMVHAFDGELRGASVAVTAARVEAPDHAYVVSDSALAALRWAPGASSAVLGFDHTLDLESCRRLIGVSCRGRERRTPPTALAAVQDSRGRFSTLVMATGYNDAPANFETAFRQIVAEARAQGYDRIVWWSLRSDVTYVSPGALGNHVAFAAMNATLRQLLASGEFPDVTMADWGGYTAARPEWFASDGVHYTTLGAWASADYLSRKMAFLDGRPCPMPRAPGLPREAPCPDPDVTGPVADIRALYPIGVEGVFCYEIGDTREYECR